MRQPDETFQSVPRCGACAFEHACGLFDRCEPVSKRSPDAERESRSALPVAA